MSESELKKENTDKLENIEVINKNTAGNCYWWEMKFKNCNLQALTYYENKIAGSSFKKSYLYKMTLYRTM